jgi:hypothetical protein
MPPDQPQRGPTEKEEWMGMAINHAIATRSPAAVIRGAEWMDSAVALLLAQDGITNGAIYALLSLALVLVFAVTRVIFIPQGEYVAYGALSMAASMRACCHRPCGWWSSLGIAVAIVDSVAALREGASRACR